MLKTFIVVGSLVCALVPFVYAQPQECSLFLANPVFTKTTIEKSQATRDSFKQLQCSANWKSASEAQSAGVSAEVPIYNLPVPIDVNWDNTRVEQWKSTNCTDADRRSDFAGRLYQSTYAVDPITAKTALSCFQAKFEAESQSPRALRCRLTETSGSLLFEAEWRRTPGETGNPPKVRVFTPVNTTCQNSTVLNENQDVPEGGVAVLCAVTDKAAAFSLNTTRGMCTASAALRLPKVILPPTLSLSGPYFQAGGEIVIPTGARIVTNGFPFTLRADKLTIEGSASVVSFTAKNMASQQAGRYAGFISITAKEVAGQGLSILNAGEPGGPGVAGPKGNPGPQGAVGSGRSPAESSCGPLDFVCRNIPLTCTGGRDGGQGGAGGQGFPGTPGAPGGGAGEVLIDVPADAQTAFQVLTDINLSGQVQQCNGAICGGTGGVGGPGGPGGDGGPGGQGGQSTLTCGGTNPGPQGPTGPGGQQGPQGPNGPNARVKFN